MKKILLLFAMLLFPGLARAQASFIVPVNLTTGNAVTGATVTLTCTVSGGCQTGGPYTSTSDSNGNAQFTGVLNGTYTVQISGRGISTYSYTLSVPCATCGTFVVNQPFSASEAFGYIAGAVTTNFALQLTGNVISSSITGTLGPGNSAQFMLCQDATGGRTFSWPANVLNPPTLLSAANACTASTFVYCGVLGAGAACPATDWQNTDQNPVGSGGGSISGSIASSQVAYGSGTNTITGSNQLTFNPNAVSSSPNLIVQGASGTSSVIEVQSNLSSGNTVQLVQAANSAQWQLIGSGTTPSLLGQIAGDLSVSNGIVSGTGGIGTPPSYIGFQGNTGSNPSVLSGTGTVSFLGPVNNTFTSYALQYPTSAPSGTQYLGCNSPTLSVSTCSWSNGPSPLSGMTAGQVPLAATATTVTSSAALQGTDAKILSSGTVSGTGAALCTDANGGATTSGCPSVPTKICSQVAITMRTSAIASGANDSSAATGACTGLTISDSVTCTFAANPTGNTGFQATTSGTLNIYTWPTANTINALYQNNTAGSITPAAETLNCNAWR